MHVSFPQSGLASWSPPPSVPQRLYYRVRHTLALECCLVLCAVHWRCLVTQCGSDTCLGCGRGKWCCGGDKTWCCSCDVTERPGYTAVACRCISRPCSILLLSVSADTSSFSYFQIILFVCTFVVFVVASHFCLCWETLAAARNKTQQKRELGLLCTILNWTEQNRCIMYTSLHISHKLYYHYKSEYLNMAFFSRTVWDWNQVFHWARPVLDPVHIIQSAITTTTTTTTTTPLSPDPKCKTPVKPLQQTVCFVVIYPCLLKFICFPG